jgi:4-hydroxy-3-methylbut-2-enyl diphosphate reductase IspH
MSLATVTATAQDADELSDRVRDVEVRQAGEESTKVMVKQNTERLQRLEAIMEKLAEQQAKAMANQAAICQATSARCAQ